ncbi:MAG: DUF4352 domain-containing protein [Syntrophomonadaceae bacterium]|jgi:RNA polymerase subunit RPABC4/transcription elongation factor Spt4|nr:DUF4352 domain-containing protein [Syntrophomonadaceae bacterium]
MAKMINCKTCQAEITSTAKICPNCGAKNKKPVFKKWWFWVIIVIAIGAIGLNMRGGESTTPISSTANMPTTSTESKETSSTESKSTTFSIGDLITAKDFEITVDDVGFTNKVGGQYLSSTPAEGGIYVTLDVSYKNISNEPKSSFRTPSFNLVDPNGVKYSTDISASSYYATEKDPNRKVFSDLNPGIKVSDNKVFEVSEDLFGDGEGWQISVSADKDYYVSIK